MATTNRDRVGKALDLLKDGLRPYVERECETRHGKYWITEVTRHWHSDLNWPAGQEMPSLDAGPMLRILWDQWNEIFRTTLGQAERSLVSELREVRNKWAHQEAFSGDDTYRALDSAERLLTAVSAPQADEVEKMKAELLRLRYDEQVRSEKRKSAGTAIESTSTANLKPWREVVTPHRDVASGRYQQAEFAADLWQVHLGQGTAEYRDPVEFYRRTYLTQSLKDMLIGAVRRMSGQGGDPVVQLQTNFGGGKTHSMLALFHLFSGVPTTELAGIDEVMQEAGAAALPAVRRVVLVGNKISPGNPSVKDDGTEVRTLWGELAWQLGGRPAYERIRADDERATSPGDKLRELFTEYGPCLILIDEWVAYARQLHDQSDLPAGGFETQFTFAQVLTESAKLANNCLLVISLPASDTAGSPHTHADDVEVGGQRGREALDRLRNVVGRIESSWRPASAEEGFEIVRRRLFEPLTDQAQFKDRDVVARGFADFYQAQSQEFPPECREPDYEKRIKAAYPIHPEIFDRLYTDWSSLVKFQRTRGVLRLMAAVIHSLWEKGDRSPLILPANIAIDDPRVQFELTRYLSDNWVPVIEKDVDGPASLPMRVDSEMSSFGKLSACRRVARVIYMGSAPTSTAAHRGIEDRRIKLGCVMPGEPTGTFGDALRRLAVAATYLYQDGGRYWYSTQPTVTKLAEDRAEQLTRDTSGKVAAELERRVRENLAQADVFRGHLHILPKSAHDVEDRTDARLVVLGIEHPYSKDAACAAEAAARAILESRGSGPRIYRNTLVFLAPDKTRLQDLDEAARKYLAWASILAEAGESGLNLTPQQVSQAKSQLATADSMVTARIPETYQWLLVPVQASPQDATARWQAIRLSGSDALAVRAAKKLRGEELLLVGYAATRLSHDLNRVPLWRGNHVSVKQLAEDYAQYNYLDRLADSTVLVTAVNEGVGLLTWEQETFAFADDFDESTGRYLGLRGGQPLHLAPEDLRGLLVKPDVARAQLAADAAARLPVDPVVPPVDDGTDTKPEPLSGTPPPPPVTAPVRSKPTHFHGSVDIEPLRLIPAFSKVVEEVIQHLAGLPGAKVKVTVEIAAEVPSGVPEGIMRAVTENSNTLKFTSQGFED